jgi:hypothetical protein
VSNTVAPGQRWRAGLAGAAALALVAVLGCDEEFSAVHVGPEITVTASNATYPTVAMGSEGKSYVVWVGDDDNLYLAAAERAGSYSAPVRVNDIDGDAASHEQAPPQVAVGPEGHVYVVWQNNTAIEGRQYPASDLRFAVSRDGGRSFAAAIHVNDDAGEFPTSHTFHDVAVGLDGVVYVSWIDSRERDRVAATMPGGAAGHEAHLPGHEIRVARSTDGGRSFGPSVIVDRSSCPCCRTAMAAAPDGSVYVAWRRVDPGDVRDIVVARADSRDFSFGPPVRVHPDNWVYPGCPHAGPALAVADDGRLHVAWYTGADGRQGVWYAASPDRGASFDKPVALLTDEWVPPTLVRLGATSDAVWAAWDDRRADPVTVRVARWSSGSRPSGFTEDAGAGRAPAVGMGHDEMIVAWLDGEAIRARQIGESHDR